MVDCITTLWRNPRCLSGLSPPHSFPSCWDVVPAIHSRSRPVYPPWSTGPRPPAQLTFSHSVGEGVLTDSRGWMAVSASGRIAVEDPALCRTSVFQLTTGRLLYQVGRCGAGPGEAQRIASLMFFGDTLAVVDGALRTMSRFDEAGRFIDRTSTASLSGDMRIDPGSLGVLGDSTLVAAGARLSLDAPMLVTLQRDGGGAKRRFLRQVSGARTNARVEQLGVRVCAAAWPSGPTIIAGNMYDLEAVAIA